MSNQHLGSCLCGAARFRVDGSFDRFYLCHCEHCRKDTGSAHAASLFSQTATLSWITGQDKVVVYNLPQTRHTKAFCSVCGSALPYALGTMVVVPAGSLDTNPGNIPDAHIFFASKAEWEGDFSGLPAFEAFPS